MGIGSILIVDDDEDILKIFKKILEEENYIVETAITGKQAIKKAEEKSYDLVLLDIMLPDMLGDKVAIELKKHDFSIEIIFITGYSEFQSCINSLGIGACDILLKPISFEDLLDAVENALLLRTNVKSMI